MFAIRPPLSRYPQHSALRQGLDLAFGLSFALRPQFPYTLPTLFKPVLPTQTPQLDSQERPDPKGIAGMRNSIICIYSILFIYLSTSSTAQGGGGSFKIG